MSTSRVEVVRDGRRIALEYAWVGAAAGAPVVVFLHEGLGSVSLWRDFPQRLCAALGARGLVYSRYGYGASTPRREPFARDYLAREAGEVLPQLLAELAIDRPCLFGHSDGASIALLAAAQAPQRYPAIVVLAPHVNVEAQCVDGVARARLAFEQGDLRARLARHHGDVDSAFYGWNDIWLAAAFRDWNIEAESAQIACPVLAIQGEADEYASLEQIYAIARRAPRVQTIALAACAHSPHRDQPAAVISATRRFLEASATLPPPQ